MNIIFAEIKNLSKILNLVLLTPIITNWPAQNDVLNIVCDLLMNKRRSFESDHKGKQKSKVNHTSFVVMS